MIGRRARRRERLEFGKVRRHVSQGRVLRVRASGVDSSSRPTRSARRMSRVLRMRVDRVDEVPAFPTFVQFREQLGTRGLEW